MWGSTHYSARPTPNVWQVLRLSTALCQHTCAPVVRPYDCKHARSTAHHPTFRAPHHCHVHNVPVHPATHPQPRTVPGFIGSRGTASAMQMCGCSVDVADVIVAEHTVFGYLSRGCQRTLTAHLNAHNTNASPSFKPDCRCIHAADAPQACIHSQTGVPGKECNNNALPPQRPCSQ